MSASQPCRVRASDLALEASYTPGSRMTVGAVIAPPHPLYGGTLTNPVVVAIRDALLHLGCATLCFNFRGTEESQGVASDSLEAAVLDYQGSLEELALRVPGPYLAAGYSFGAGSALLAARDDARVRGVVLLAPPVGMLRSADLAAFHGEVLIVVGDDDEYAPLRDLETCVRNAERACNLETIPGADHFFHYGGLSEIGPRITRCVRGWL